MGISIEVVLVTTNEDRFKERAESDLHQRRELAATTPRIANTHLRAGQPMIFYCKACGWPSDIKHETWFLKEPRAMCGECEAMIERGWLDPSEEWQRITEPHIPPLNTSTGPVLP